MSNNLETIATLEDENKTLRMRVAELEQALLVEHSYTGMASRGDDGNGAMIPFASHSELEQRVEERTAELTRINQALQNEIIERQQVEDELRKLQRAVEQSPASIVITDTMGRIEYVNPKFTRATGYTLAEALGQNPRVLKSGEIPPEGYRDLWKMITSGNEWRGEFHNKRKDGELFWEYASISPIFSEDGKITHFLAVKEDITERKRAEDALRSNLELLERLIDTIPSPVFYKDTEGRFLGCNSYFIEQIIGLPREQIVGRKMDELPDALSPDVARVHHDHDMELLRSPGKQVYETHMPCADGKERFFLVSKATFQEASGNVAGIIGVMLDITERRESEERQRAIYQTIKTLNDRLQQEMNMARTIQHSLLPPAEPGWPNLDVVCYSTPAREVGGDLYVYRALQFPSRLQPVGRYALAVGDVSGKGMPASLLMAVSLVLFHSVIGKGMSPSALLSYLDDALVHYTRTTQQNCAMTYMEIEVTSPYQTQSELRRTTGSSTSAALRRTASLYIANAGCISPVVRRVDGSIIWLDANGMPLGVGMGATYGYEEVSLDMEAGDIVVLVSDGVIEATNETRELFGFERFEHALITGPLSSAEAMLFHLRAALTDFVGDIEPHDDMTIIVVQV